VDGGAYQAPTGRWGAWRGLHAKTNHHIHQALAHERAAVVRRRADEVRLHPRSPQPRRDWPAAAPVLSVLAGFLGLLAIAAPSL
jgi:hypothetical protein